MNKASHKRADLWGSPPFCSLIDSSWAADDVAATVGDMLLLLGIFRNTVTSIMHLRKI